MKYVLILVSLIVVGSQNLFAKQTCTPKADPVLMRQAIDIKNAIHKRDVRSIAAIAPIEDKDERGNLLHETMSRLFGTKGATHRSVESVLRGALSICYFVEKYRLPSPDGSDEFVRVFMFDSRKIRVAHAAHDISCKKWFEDFVFVEFVRVKKSWKLYRLFHDETEFLSDQECAQK